MDLEEGTREFHNLLSKIHPRLLPQFISWIQDHVEVLERGKFYNYTLITYVLPLVINYCCCFYLPVFGWMEVLFFFNFAINGRFL